MAFYIDHDDMQALLLGGCLFGSGGGGTVESASHLAEHFVAGPYYPTTRVRVVAVEEATEGRAVMVAYMGAPVAINGALYPDGAVKAVEQVQAYLEKQPESPQLAYVVPDESGALGFLVACLVAAKLGLAVVDADGAGRAVPSLPMLTYAAAHLNPRPVMLASQGGLAVELDVTPRPEHQLGSAGHQQDVSAIIEQMLRPIVAEAEFGQFGGLAMWIMTRDTLAAALPIRGTLSRSLKVGRQLKNGALRSAADAVHYLREECGLVARTVFGPGILQGIESGTGGGFDAGKVVIRDGTRTCTLLFENESLLAWVSDQPQPIVMAPDSLAYFVENERQQVFSNGDLLLPDGKLNPLVDGKPISVLGIGAAAPLKVEDGLILNSFKAVLERMGYLGPYLPLSQSNGGAQ